MGRRASGTTLAAPVAKAAQRPKARGQEAPGGGPAALEGRSGGMAGVRLEGHVLWRRRLEIENSVPYHLGGQRLDRGGDRGDPGGSA